MVCEMIIREFEHDSPRDYSVKPAFQVGEQVRISDGPFASFNGVVAEVDEARSCLNIAISIFGRPKPVEIEFGQVGKLSIAYLATEWKSI